MINICRTPKSLVISMNDFEYILLFAGCGAIMGILVGIKRKRDKRKNSQKSIEIRGGYDEYTDLEIEKFTELNERILKKVMKRILRFLSREDVKIEATEMIERCIADPTKNYEIVDKSIKSGINYVIIKNKNKLDQKALVQLISRALIFATIKSEIGPILVRSFYELVVAKGIKKTLLGFMTAGLTLLFSAELLPLGVIVLAGAGVYFSVFSTGNINCSRTCLELPGSSETSTVFIPKFSKQEERFILSDNKKIVKFIRKDGLAREVIIAQPNNINIEENAKLIKVETLGEETKAFSKTNIPRKTVVRKTKMTPHKNKQMKTMSELLKEGKALQHDVGENFQRENKINEKL